MAREAWRCENCTRFTFKEPEVILLNTRTYQQTMGGSIPVDGDGKPISLCPICINVAEAATEGIVLANPDGSVVR